MPDDFEIDFKIPEFFSGLGGRNVSLNQAHLIARAEWMSRIEAYALWHELELEMAKEFGLLEPVTLAALTIEELLGMLELKSSSELRDLCKSATGNKLHIDINLPDGIDSIYAQTYLQAKFDTLNRSLDDVLQAFKNLPITGAAEEIARRITTFVQDDLRMPWAWVAYELLESFYVSLSAYATLTPLKRSYYVDPPEKLAPEINYHSEAGRPIPEVIPELLCWIDTLKKLNDQPKSIPRGKSRDPEVIRRYVGWLWCHHVLGHSIAAIAKEWAVAKGLPIAKGDEVDTKEIRHGIHEARGLLGIAGQFWNHLSDDDEAIQDAQRFWALEGGEESTVEN